MADDVRTTCACADRGEPSKKCDRGDVIKDQSETEKEINTIRIRQMSWKCEGNVALNLQD